MKSLTEITKEDMHQCFNDNVQIGLQNFYNYLYQKYGIDHLSDLNKETIKIYHDLWELREKISKMIDDSAKIIDVR